MSSTHSRVMTLILFWLAVTLTILTTACNKNKQGEWRTPPAPQPSATPQPTTVTRTVHPSARPTPTEGQPTILAPAPNLDSQPTERKTVVHDPKDMTADQVYSESAKFGPPKGGNIPSDIKDRSGNSFVYSGAGVDDLRERLHNKVNGSGSEEQKAIDRQFAAGVSLGTYEVDWESRRVRASVTVKRAGQNVQFDFFGRLDANRSFRAGDLKLHPFIEAEMTCMDSLNNKCSTAHIFVRDGFGERVKSAHVLVRQTSANIHVEGPGFGLAKNPEYDRFLNLLLNTVKQAGGLNHVEEIRYVTSETVNGPSIFFVTMKLLMAEGWPTRAVSEQYLAFMGPLVKPLGTETDLDHRIHVLPSIISIEGQMLLADPLIADTISHIRLIKNDGRGNPTFAITVRRNEWGSREETLHLTLLRKTARVRDTVQD